MCPKLPSKSPFASTYSLTAQEPVSESDSGSALGRTLSGDRDNIDQIPPARALQKAFAQRITTHKRLAQGFGVDSFVKLL